jgi:hypothetical protein
VPGGTATEPALLFSVDFALFMNAVIENEELVREDPEIVGCQTPSADTHSAFGKRRAADGRGGA